MKKFVEFSLYEYMDEHPTQQVRTWEGETIEAIEADARAWAKQMTEKLVRNVQIKDIFREVG